jgi:xanthine/CO dehydrogenase XdhC/CoxF family maturation factor
METAVSILAEIISRRAHRSGSPLTETGGSIRSQAIPSVS